MMTSSNRSTPYPAAPFPITVPDCIWAATLDEVARYRLVDSEGLVFWGGVVTTDVGVVTGLYLPTHAPQGARAALEPDEARWLLRCLRDRGEKLLAQVHSHPGRAFHSHGDDRHATSYHHGAYSIVIPNYGAGVTAITDCAVHFYNCQRFELVNPDDASRLVHVTTSTERLRAIPTAEEQGDQVPRRRWWTWLVSKVRLRPNALSKR